MKIKMKFEYGGNVKKRCEKVTCCEYSLVAP